MSLTREDQVALLEGHDTRDVLDQFRDPVQHQRGVVVLPDLAVDLSKRKSHISTPASTRREGGKRTLYQRRRLCGSWTLSFGMNCPTGQKVSKPCMEKCHKGQRGSSGKRRGTRSTDFGRTPGKTFCLDSVLHVAGSVVDSEGLRFSSAVST